MWVKLDDDFYVHPKVVMAGPEAAYLYVAGLCFCGKHLTDGVIPKAMVPTLANHRKPLDLAATLVKVRLWVDDGDNYIVNGYHDYNPPAAKVKAQREADRDRKAAGFGTGDFPNGTDADSESVPAGKLSEGDRKKRVLIPYPSLGTTDVVPKRAKRGSTVPDDFTVTIPMRQWADDTVPSVNIDTQTAQFLDYHAAKGSTFKDWQAAWRTWMRRSAEYAKAGRVSVRKPGRVEQSWSALGDG